MERVPEPELMTEADQAKAYAAADFDTPNQAFVERFLSTFPDFTTGSIVDFGCGPADICVRLARRLPNVKITGVDGSAAMLARAELDDVASRVELVEAILPNAVDTTYDAVISNSLLHHLADPKVLWSEIRRAANPGAPVLVVDLFRPPSLDDVQRLVDEYSDGEPDVLRRDFYNSLRAAFTVDEIEAQLAEANLSLSVETISDRHVAIAGHIRG